MKDSQPLSSFPLDLEEERIPPHGRGTFYSDADEGNPYRLFLHQKKKKYSQEWLSLWMQPSDVGVSLMELARNDTLTRTDYRILCWVLSHVRLGNELLLCHSHIAEDLNMKRSNVSASVKRLCNIGVLLKTGEKMGRVNNYRLSPALAYRGSLSEGVKERNLTIKQRAKIIPFSSHNQEYMS